MDPSGSGNNSPRASESPKITNKARKSSSASVSAVKDKDGGLGSADKRKRNRAKLSCAECRRLKLKCNRIWPCDQCCKRDRADLCPDQALEEPSRQRTREARELYAARERIQLLEKMLRDRGIVLPEDARKDDDEYGEMEHAERAAAETLQRLGTLTLEQGGITKFYGTTAQSVLIKDESDDEGTLAGCTAGSRSDDEMDPVSSMFSTIRGNEAVWKAHLPPYERAKQLTQYYIHYSTWMFSPISPEKICQCYLGGNYFTQFKYTTKPQKLAVLYMIFALGSLFDPSFTPTEQENVPNEAKGYFRAAQTCLASADIASNPSVSAVACIILMGTYLLNAKLGGAPAIWPLFGIGLKLATMMGLHRDGRSWKLPAADEQFRARLFWELQAYDRLQALLWGRPYSLSKNLYDTPIPSGGHEENTHGPNLDVPDPVHVPEMPPEEKESWEAFHEWKWRFSHELLGKVIDDAFSTRIPTYQETLNLEATLREFDRKIPVSIKNGGIPASSLCGKGGTSSTNTGPATFANVMQQTAMGVMMNEVLLFLHRPYYVQALQSYSEEPLRSPFAKSVVTVTLEAARNLINVVRHMITCYPQMSVRWWFPLWHAYGAASCQAALLLKSPWSALVPGVAGELSNAIAVFELASNNGSLRANDLLPRLKKLSDRAFARVADFQSGIIRMGAPSSEGSRDDPEVDRDLAQLGTSTYVHGRSKLTYQKHNTTGRQSLECGGGLAAAAAADSPDSLASASTGSRASGSISIDTPDGPVTPGQGASLFPPSSSSSLPFDFFDFGKLSGASGTPGVFSSASSDSAMANISALLSSYNSQASNSQASQVAPPAHQTSAPSTTDQTFPFGNAAGSWWPGQMPMFPPGPAMSPHQMDGGKPPSGDPDDLFGVSGVNAAAQPNSSGMWSNNWASLFGDADDQMGLGPKMFGTM